MLKNLNKGIGGYFEIELRDGDFPHSGNILLNSGRSCLSYLLKAKMPRHVYLPRYTCSAVINPIVALGIPYTLLPITKELRLDGEVKLKRHDLIIINNYFGVMDDYCKLMGSLFGDQLLIDSSQAFFFTPQNDSHCFYSPRKFFGVPDGGILITDAVLPCTLEVDVSHSRVQHLVKRAELGPESAYDDFARNEEELAQAPMKSMSVLTRRMLGAIDYDEAKERRLRNFGILFDALNKKNLIRVSRDKNACPMSFPFLTETPGLRSKLIKNKIFVPRYWPNVLASCNPDQDEFKMANSLLALPTDHRYGDSEMAQIIRTILE